MRAAMRSAAMVESRVSATNAQPPSCAARTSRTRSTSRKKGASVPRSPASTTRRNPPERSSSSTARSACTRPWGRTRSGPSSQNAPAIVPATSIQAARSPCAIAVLHAARMMEVAPPPGSHTVSRPSGNPPPGSALSSCAIPVTTGSAVCCAIWTASGKRCSRRTRSAATWADTG